MKKTKSQKGLDWFFWISVLIILGLLIHSIVSAQYIINQKGVGSFLDGKWIVDDLEKDTVKHTFNYIVEYREWFDFNTAGTVYYNGDFKALAGWHRKLIGFDTYEQMIKWLNGGSIVMVDGDKVPRLDESEFVKAYDMRRMEVIELELVTEHKERQIIHEAYEKRYWK